MPQYESNTQPLPYHVSVQPPIILVVLHKYLVCPHSGLNGRPLPYHGSALPTELCGLKLDLEIKKHL